MDFLNKAFEQLKELYLQLSPGSRVIAVLLAGVLVVSLGFLFVQSLPSQSNVCLFDNQSFNSDELKKMESALGTAGLSDYEIVGGRIQVPRNKRAEYMAAIVQGEALPNGYGDMMAKMLESDSPWTNETTRKNFLDLAIIQEAQSVISAFNGIQSASITISEGVKPGWNREQIFSANVTVRPTGDQLDPKLIPTIIRYVAGLKAGMEPKDVTLVDEKTGLSNTGDENGFAGPAGPYQLAVEHVSKWWDKETEGIVAYIPGAIVQTGVELNEDIRREELQVEHGKASAVQLATESMSRERQGNDLAGEPGYTAQDNQPAPGPMAARAVAGEHETESSDSEAIVNVLPGMRMTRELAPLVTKKVKVTIQIPHTYVLNAWHQEHPTPEGEEAAAPDAALLEAFKSQLFDSIRQRVANLLPEPEGIVDMTTLVQVGVYYPVPTVPIAEPTFMDTATAWLVVNWPTIGMFALIGASMLMLRSMLRERPIEEAAEEEEEAMAYAQRVPGEEEPEEGEEHERVLPEFESGRSLKEELSELVNENPEAAANVLRQWIGSAATSV